MRCWASNPDAGAPVVLLLQPCITVKDVVVFTATSPYLSFLFLFRPRLVFVSEQTGGMQSIHLNAKHALAVVAVHRHRGDALFLPLGRESVPGHSGSALRCFLRPRLLIFVSHSYKKSSSFGVRIGE